MGTPEVRFSDLTLTLIIRDYFRSREKDRWTHWLLTLSFTDMVDEHENSDPYMLHMDLILRTVLSYIEYYALDRFIYNVK